MIESKIFEIRDRATMIPALAVKLDSTTQAERYCLDRTGYGTTSEEHRKYILLMRMAGGEGKFDCDPNGWAGSGRTMTIAHKYIMEHFDALLSGDVIDVEFILGESDVKKTSEALE